MAGVDLLSSSVGKPSLMPVTLLSTSSSVAFAERLAGHLGVPLAQPERKLFPDGESYLRLPLSGRLELLCSDVVLVGATDSEASIEELYRLSCAAVKAGARTLVLVIPY